MAKIRVLIVDDSPFIHKAINRAIGSDEEFEICGIAKNGKEGVELFSTVRPDVVTMDITMPVMDGLAASKEILTQNRAAKIIMLSAMGDEELMAGARAMGIKAFLQKPFKNDELKTAIQNIVKE